MILLAPQGQYKGRSRKHRGRRPSTPKTIEARVRGIVAEVLCIDDEELTLETRLVDDLEIDFQDRVEIVMVLEEAFGVEISEAKGEALETLADVMRAIGRAEG